MLASISATRAPTPHLAWFGFAQGGVMDGKKKFLRINRDGPDGSGLPRTVHDASDTTVDGASQPRAYTAYTDPSGVFTVGVWACDPGTLVIEDLAIDEACYLIKGEVIISDPHGNSERFTAGEAFLLQRGFVGIWHMPGPILKYNAMFKR
jgi:uncharacterized cupin superfamily protein